MASDIPATGWDGPGLGEWDLRSLVGHTSRSLSTVGSYLRRPADTEDITSPQHYYRYVREVAAQTGADAIVERGRQAGRELGPDPAAAIDRLVESALVDVAGVDDPLIEVIGGAGIRLSNYLPTRTFELAVHGLDIARAADIPFRLPDRVLAEATVLATLIAAESGVGQTVLLALTGRIALPVGFSVV